jgi:hypothetical protein
VQLRRYEEVLDQSTLQFERQDSGGMAASILMMLMRQLDTMNSSLDRWEQQERKQERRERKKRKLRKKRRAMKKAKKKAKKPCLQALMTMVER